MPVQFGGGLRSLASIDAALAAGAERVILGTAAYTDVDFLDDAVAKHGDRVIVSVDVRGGRVASAGWTHQTEMEASARDRAPPAPRREAARLLDHRARRDADRAGRRRGAAASPRSCAARSPTRAGSARSRTCRALAGLRQVNLTGVIVGKALYERRFGVGEAVEALGPEPERKNGRRRPARKA